MPKKFNPNAKRETRLRRWLNVLNARLVDGFCEGWCGKRHWTVADQVKSVKAKIATAEKELAELSERK
jgi:hypothetical protein